jgi:HAD superfamily hydrolase (TIGR01484 family)
LQPLASGATHALRSIRGVFFDIDDTLTTHGRLTAEAYAALERVQAAGLVCVPVTGRPAGWCDHIARMWPVDAVVGENGAFYFRYDEAARRMDRVFAHDEETRAVHRARFDEIAAEIVREVPGAAVSADQRYRETDLAIDFCEDVPRLDAAAIERIAAIMRRRGMTAKVSSIHVNGWFGEYDKLGMVQRLLRAGGIEPERDRAQYVFVGDSPNDSPMFGFFPNSIGVANLRDWLSRTEHLPAYITAQACGAGFAEAVDCILAAQEPPK